MITPTEIRRALAGDRSMCLHRLRGRPVEDWRSVLAAEQGRRRPRKRLTATLAERIADMDPLAPTGIAAILRDLMAAEEEDPRRGAPEGNQNAVKNDGYDTVIRIRCHAADKGEWNLKARKAGLDLSEWIRTRLNRATD